MDCPQNKRVSKKVDGPYGTICIRYATKLFHIQHATHHATLTFSHPSLKIRSTLSLMARLLFALHIEVQDSLGYWLVLGHNDIVIECHTSLAKITKFGNYPTVYTKKFGKHFHIPQIFIKMVKLHNSFTLMDCLD